MNFSNDAGRFSIGFQHLCSVFLGSILDNMLTTQGYIGVARREMNDFNNMLLMGAEMG